jgi:hypothetical protein
MADDIKAGNVTPSKSVTVATQLLSYNTTELNELLAFITNYQSIREYLPKGSVTTEWLFGKEVKLEKGEKGWSASEATKETTPS